MIIIIDNKSFCKKATKFAKARSLNIVNGSKDSYVKDFKGGTNYTSAFKFGREIIEADEERQKKLLKKFLDSGSVTRTLAHLMALQLSDIDSNVFLIIDKSAYEVAAERIVKRLNKLVGLDKGDMIVTYHDHEIFADFFKKSKSGEKTKKEKEYNKKKLGLSAKDLTILDKELNDMFDEFSNIDKKEARKYFIENATPPKKAIKIAHKFMGDHKAIFKEYDDEFRDLPSISEI